MRKINNCKITGVKTKITEELTITVKLEFVSRRDKGTYSFTKRFYDAKENAELKTIMYYADVKKIKELKGKVIREVVDEDENFIGIGEPIGDNFVLFRDTSKSYSAAELNK